MPGIRGRRVDEDDDRPAELLGQPHRAQRLAVALGPRVAEVPEDLVLGVAALDVADEQHRLALVVGEAGHDRVIVGEAAVAVNLDEAGEQPLDEVLEARAGSGCRATSTRCHGVSDAIEVGAHRLEPALAATRSRDRARRCAAAASSASISFSRTAIGSSKSRVSSGIRFGRPRSRVTKHDVDGAQLVTAATPIPARRPARPPRSAPATAARGSATTRRRGRADGVGAGRQLDLERHAPIAAMAREDLAERLEHAAVGRHPDADRHLARQPLAHAVDAARSPTPASAPTRRRARACRGRAPACRSRSGAALR